MTATLSPIKIGRHPWQVLLPHRADNIQAAAVQVNHSKPTQTNGSIFSTAPAAACVTT